MKVDLILYVILIFFSGWGAGMAYTNELEALSAAKAEYTENDSLGIAELQIDGTMNVINVDTLVETENKKVKPEPVSLIIDRTSDYHVDIAMLDSLAPYPLLAYTTVIAESGWPGGKSNLAKRVNNNIGMMIPLSRFNAGTIEDTARIRKNLGLVFGKHYGIYYYKGQPVKNRQGKVMVCWNKRWAIFPSLVDCARDIGEYQTRLVSKAQASTPRRYLNRLGELNYYGKSDVAAGYIKHWMSIYNKLYSTIGHYDHRLNKIDSIMVN